ncbi:MAG TPA: EthD family reductase [Candidatus Limnocylindrales bacterium]|nr:EthD family reductase [Candidatus Limnocylindrales bacterium]
MPRLVVLYNRPEDTDAFDAHYRDVHMPIVSRYPNLRTTRLSKLEGVGGREPAHYLMAEMAFDTAADLDEALASASGAASAKDLRNFAGAGVTMFIAPDEADA